MQLFRTVTSVFLTWLLIFSSTIANAQTISGVVVDVPDLEEAPAIVSQVPGYYYPNYKMDDAWSAIQDKFVQINAAKNTGIGLESIFFQELAQDFERAFPHLPNESKFRVTYEQCRLLAGQLSQEYSREVFSQFIQGCHKPLEKDMSEMRAKYTIKPTISANPSTGPLPLTVTFDARGSVDPSIATIPSANYFWYFKDVFGVDQSIGQGPVVTYTFTEPGDHVVYLTVRSANQATQGILDGETTTTISVEPEAATIVLFANGRQMNEKDVTKVGTIEAQEGVTFDATGTIPKGGRIIAEHTRDIKSEGRSLFKKTFEGAPGSVAVEFPEEGQFSVSLSVMDNQNNKLTRNYKLAVADPLAIIKTTPEEGDTGTTFRFDASSSYSLVSKIRQYTWDVINPQGEKIDTLQSKTISKQFSYPGPYKIQLTVEDEQGRRNTETFNLNVESTEPIAQFSMDPADDREFPSQYWLDGSLSSDIDVLGADDSLSYQWRFNPEQHVVVNEIIEDGKKILVSFEEKGDFTVKLTVSDNYGKLSEIEKELTVESTLRPQLFINPVATFRGAAVRFLTKTNKEVVFYEWDMGDGETREVSTPALIHSYDEVGVYPVSLTVYTDDDEYNTITKQVFIGEKDSPIIAYETKDKINHILKQDDMCIVDGKEEAAYHVARGEEITIDVSKSVNTKGEKQGLEVYFQPQNDDIYKQRNFRYRFVELGCNFVDIKAEDTAAGVVTTQRVWYKVVNDLPTLQNVMLQFPQYGDKIGIGLDLQQSADQDNTFEATDFSNLIVKVIAQGTNDSDGAIAFYKWYYYNKANPSRVLETKVTPANIPETYFTLQKIPGEYEFGVTLVDNDGGESKSQSIIGHGPTVFFPPDSKNLDIPIVTLKQSTVTAKVGEDIQFDVIAKILADRPDFDINKSVKYDFDGDGEFDIPPTKEMSASYYFTEPGTYTPSVKVLYRGIPGTARGEPITVEAGLVPLLLTESAGNLVIGREVSIGDVATSELCLDTENCAIRGDLKTMWNVTGDNNDSIRSFIYEFDGNGEYNRSLDVTDEYGNKANKTGVLTTTATGGVDQAFLSIPKAQHEDGQSIITVGRQLHDAVVYFLPQQGDGECFLDVDVTNDSDGDGDKEMDYDIPCNELAHFQYSPLFDSVLGRWYTQQGTGWDTRDVLVNFLDKRIEIDSKYATVYQDITNFIPLLDGSDPDVAYLKDLLLSLRNNLDDNAIRGANLVALSNHFDAIENKLSEQETNRLDVIIFSLSDGDVSAALGGNAYDQARQDILLLVPSTIKETISPYFDAIDSANGDRDIIKSSLQQIIDTLRSNQGDGPNQIDPLDIDLIVMPKICQILVFFDIGSDACGGVVLNEANNGTGTESNIIPSDTVGVDDVSDTGLFQKILRWVLYVVIGLVIILACVFVFYLIKARLSNKDEEEDGETE